MKIEALTVEDYMTQVPTDRQEAFNKLRGIILDNLPAGFKEMMNYDMIGYVVPHSIYPAGYHCDTALPLPFMNLGSQKNFIGVYHMGIYSDKALLEWFQEEYKKRCKYKLDMGKSCIRLKRMDDIPFELIGELVSKITVDQWIKIYEGSRR